MKWQVTFSPQALADIEQVLDRTSRHFGHTKRNEYVDLPGLAVADLATDPKHFRSQSREDLNPGARTCHIGRRGKKARHLFVYRSIGNTTIEIARCLHDAMEARLHLPDDFFKPESFD